MFLKYCENVIATQNMLNSFKLHCIHILNGGGGGVDASKADLFKEALIYFVFSLAHFIELNILSLQKCNCWKKINTLAKNSVWVQAFYILFL